MQSKPPIQVYWMKPRFGEVKINIYGNRAGDPPVAGFGGLLRDHMGKLLKGYSGKLGNHSVLYTDLYSIKIWVAHGLKDGN